MVFTFAGNVGTLGAVITLSIAVVKAVLKVPLVCFGLKAQVLLHIPQISAHSSSDFLFALFCVRVGGCHPAVASAKPPSREA